MAVLMSARVSHIRALPCGALSLIRADFQTSGVKFRHLLPPGSPQLRGTGVTSPVRSHINAAVRGDRFSTTAAALRKSSQANGSSSPRGRRGWLGKFALGAALGVGTGALVQALHTGVLTAMPLKMNLDSAESDWKEAKDFLLSLSVKDRRGYYRTSGSVPLGDIPVWTPTAGASKSSRYLRNETLDQKISVYSGDITKLEIDAIVNAGMGEKEPIAELSKTFGCHVGERLSFLFFSVSVSADVIHTVGPIAQGGVGESERRALRSCYWNSLQTATENAARSVAFPCISTGIYGYPPEQAVHEALAAVREFLDAHHDKVGICGCV
uniref:Mono-ADP ribosylhydrolase 1 n=1 Tax=Xiphophorus couchianus TaxID=32473 RepID=A0A3B5KVJ7_9TELE